MGIVEYLSRDPYNDPWPESELDEKIVVARFNSFHEALECMNSRLENIGRHKRNENFLVCSRRNVAKNSSLSGCYGNQNGQKPTKLDRHEKNQFSRLPKQLNSSSQKKTNNFYSISKQQTVVPESCKNSQKKFNDSKSEQKTDSRKEISKNSIAPRTGGRIPYKIG